MEKTAVVEQAETKVTAEQHDAIRSVGKDICLSAGAGSGKTFVLVQRYCALLARALDDGDVHLRSILAITFTEKAAREMKDRIREECDAAYRRCREKGDARRALRWKEAKNRLDGASIGTIHGFCARLLREYALEAGVDPSFRIMDEVAAHLFVTKVVHRLLVERVEKDDDAVMRLCREYGWKRVEESLVRMVAQRGEVQAALNNDSGGEKNRVKEGRKRARQRIRRRAIRDFLQDPRWREAVALVREGQASPGEAAEGKDAFFSSLDAFRGAVPDAHAGERLAELREQCLRGSVHAGKKVVKQLIAVIDDYSPHISEPEGNISEREDALYCALLRSYTSAEKRYGEEKRSAGLLDYEDLLLITRRMLARSPALLERLRRRYRSIMVDEFQDTDEIQREIIYLLCGGQTPGPGAGKLFVVGDQKQSIYRFRGADVSVFSRVRDDIVRDGGLGLKLTTNFRSQPAVVDYLNDFFHHAMGDEPGRRAYEPVYETLRAARPDSSLVPVVELLMVHGDEGEKIGDVRLREAETLGRWIAAAVGEGLPLVFEPAGEGREAARPLRYGDIAILLRAMTDVRLYEQALREAGIPYHLVAGSGFFRAQEVVDVLNLMRYLNNPRDSLWLAGVLRSPFFSLSDETLFWLARQRDITAYFPASRKAWPDEVKDAERRKCDFAQRVLERLYRNRDRWSIAELIDEADAMTGYRVALSATSGGTRKVSNLRKLVDAARDFDARGFYSLSDFVSYVNELVSREIREGEAQVETEAGDVVNICTVHRAKGLQFPVVIVPDAGRTISSKRHEPVIWGREWGVGLKLKKGRGTYDAGPVYRWVAREEARKERAEALRLLYVAATRARDYLLFSAAISGRKSGGSWLTRLGEFHGLSLGRPVRLPERVDYSHGKRSMRITVELPDSTSPGKERLPRPFSRAPEILWDAGMTPDELWSRTGPVHVPSDAGLQRLSVTQLETYRECPCRFYLRYLRDLPEPETVAGRWEGSGVTAGGVGDFIHDTLARWDFALPPETMLSAAMRRLDIAFPLLDPSRRQQCAADITAMLRGFSESECYDRLREAAAVEGALFREEPFSLNVGGAVVHGKVDLLFLQNEHGWTLADYKTEKVDTARIVEAAERFRFQMGLYALAITRIVGYDICRALVWFLRYGRIVPVGSIEELCTWAQREATEAVTAIHRGEYGSKTDSCPRCPYRAVCAERGLKKGKGAGIV